MTRFTHKFLVNRVLIYIRIFIYNNDIAIFIYYPLNITNNSIAILIIWRKFYASYNGRTWPIDELLYSSKGKFRKRRFFLVLDTYSLIYKSLESLQKASQPFSVTLIDSDASTPQSPNCITAII